MVQEFLSPRNRRLRMALGVLIGSGIVAAVSYGYANFTQGNTSLFYQQLSDPDKTCIATKVSRAFLNRLKKPGELFTQQDAAAIQTAMDCIQGVFNR